MQARRREGLRSFPLQLPQGQLIYRQIRYGPSQSLVFLLKELQFLELFCAHPAVHLLPKIKDLFGQANLSDRINPRHALPHQKLQLDAT